MRIIEITPDIIEPNEILRKYFENRSKRQKRSAGSLKALFKKQSLKEKGYTFDL